MVNEEILHGVSGGADLLAWFEGHVPSFHDAEILSVSLDRNGEVAKLAIRTWEMTSETDEAGHFINRKHVVVSLELSGVTDLSLTGFSTQNVIFGLSIEKMPRDLYRLTMEPCYGLSGSIDARTLRVTLEPGEPPAGPNAQGLTRSHRARPH